MNATSLDNTHNQLSLLSAGYLEINQGFDKITMLASLICDECSAFISFLNKQQQLIHPADRFSSSDLQLINYYSTQCLDNNDVFEVKDCHAGSAEIETFLKEKISFRFFAACRIKDINGVTAGVLYVTGKEPGSLLPKQKKSLQLLASQAAEVVDARQQREEFKHFDKLFHVSKDLICVVGPNGFFQKINPAFEVVLGWDSSRLLETSLFELVYKEDATGTLKEVAKLTSGSSIINFTNRIRCSNGEFKWLQWMASPDPLTGSFFAIARDISEEKRREMKLKISENNLKSFFEHSQGLMCTHDTQGRFISVNEAGAGMLGYKAAEVLRMSLFDLVPEKYHVSLKGYLAEINATGKSTGIMVTQHKEGHQKIWMYNNVLEKNGDGRDYIIGNAIDITERHLLERDLKKTKELLEQTSNVARVGGWEYDLKKGTIYWSNVTKVIHEVAHDYQPTLESALAFYARDCRNKITEALTLAITEGKSWEMELQIITAKGNLLWVRAKGNAELENGICKRLYGTFQDIDERKKASLALSMERSRLLAFVEHAPAAVAMFDRNLKYIAVSKRWIEEYKLENKDLIGISHYDVFPNLSDAWKEIHALCLNGAVEKNNEDVWTPPGWQHEQYLRWEVRPWYQYDGTIGGIMMFTQDITEMCLQREELRKAKKNAELASIAKSEFLANMSHEIRTPLNGVIGFTDLVLKTSLDDTQKQYLSIVNQSGNALLNIINDILDFSKIEAGKLELDVAKCDLLEITGQVADIISFQAQNKGLELLLNVPYYLPRFIWVDEIRLKQVLINLIGNAVKFTQEGEIELKIAFIKTEDTGNVVLRFEVRDSGIGIPLEKQDKIFEAFLQEDASTTRKYGGTGLGLTISNKLLGLMGSSLKLESEFGKGSRFYFDLALKAEDEHHTEAERIEKIKKVLVVDDNDNNRLIVKQMLLLKEITTVEARNGFEALNLLAAGESFDVVFMDYHMPYMNGVETIRKIRENFAHLQQLQKIVLLHSSADDQSVIRACEELKISYRLAKPIKMREMDSILSRIMLKEQTGVKRAEIAPAEAIGEEIKVLIAEDNNVNRLLAKTIVKRIAPNATIIEAANGKEALQYYQQLNPSIVLMDIQMPEMNGYEATRHIRALEAGNTHVPVIALTAGNVKGEKEKCLNAGMDDFLAKPFVEQDLDDLFARWIRQNAKEAPTLPAKQDVAKHFDLQLVISFLDDMSFLDEFLQLTKEELGIALNDLQMLAKQKDLKALKAAGHKLKGTALAAGMHELSRIAHQVEHLQIFNEIQVNALVNNAGEEIAIILACVDAVDVAVLKIA